ncbi:hypothetical protein Esti_002036 [Eimeria stiedai]
MAKKKQKAPGPQQKVDAAKARQEARRKHIEESTALLLEKGSKPQKELVREWIEEAVATKRQEVVDGLERQLGQHESFVSSANGVLQALQGSLQDTGEALDSAVHTLQQTHEQLAALQQKRVNELEEHFKARMHQLRQCYLDNINDIRDSHSKFKKEVQKLIEMIAEEEEQKGLQETHEQTSQYEIISNRAIELEHQLQSQLDQRERCLKQHIETALHSYRSATETQAQQYRKLTQQNNALSQQVLAKIKEVEKMQAAINHCKAKVAQHKHEFEARNSRIRGEVDVLRKHCKELRDEMKAQRRQRLIAVSVCAREKKKKLLEQLRLADRIHRVAALCSKYERQEIIDADPPALASEEEKASWAPESRKLHKALTELVECRENEWARLENVFRRINRVTLDAARVESSLNGLVRSNKEAEAVLQNYAASLSLLPNASASAPSDLLSVSPIRRPGRKRSG